MNTAMIMLIVCLAFAAVASAQYYYPYGHRVAYSGYPAYTYSYGYPAYTYSYGYPTAYYLKK